MAVTHDDLTRYEREATRLYVLWFTIYASLGIGAIILPGLAAMGLTFGMADGVKYLAGAGGLCAALYGFIKPNDYASAFDAAIAELRSLRARSDLLTEQQRADRLDVCLHLMAFKYQGALPAHPRQP